MKSSACVIGAGLAGCEAAHQLARAGVDVTLYEARPEYISPAHQTQDFAELVCSNSFRADGLFNAVGLLKQEMREMGSLVLEAADATCVPAGGALAVDRHLFSQYITRKILQNGHIKVVRKAVTDIPKSGIIIVAAGPLASEMLCESIAQTMGQDMLHFFDAAAPIVTAESIDMDKAFFASRYGKGTDDYLNCAMDEAQYRAFYEALTQAETTHLHGFEQTNVFEGCMPIETMAQRGYQTLTFGPLKPKGIAVPDSDQRPYAVVQLRKEDREGRLFNLVGFQTHLKFGEQRRVFRMIPGLENAEFVRYGVMHRNTYLKSPGLLSEYYEVKKRPGLFFAGQITGVEGYIESASSGMLAGIAAACDIAGKPRPVFGPRTATGALAHYVSGYAGGDFQPMNVTFGIMEALDIKAGKREKRLAISQRALGEIEKIRESLCQK